MYTVNSHDRVSELADVPQSSVGAPLPALVATEDGVFLVFYLEDTPTNWDGSSIRSVGMDSARPSGVLN